MDYIFEILKSPAGSFAQVFLLFTSLIVLTWKVSSFHTKYEGIYKLEDKIDKKVDRFDEKFDNINSKFSEFQKDINLIKNYFEVLSSKSNPMAQRKSPISLTEMGLTISKEIRANELVDKYWISIRSELEAQLKNNHNPYDIQKVSFNIADDYQNILSNDELEYIKTNAYKHGFDLSTYEMLFGVLIRDKILKEKNIEIEDIDKYEPKSVK